MTQTSLTGLQTLAKALEARIAADQAPCESGELYELLTRSLAADGARREGGGAAAMSGRVRLQRSAPLGAEPGAARGAEIVADLLALADDPGDASALVYFADAAMAAYLRSRDDELRRLYELEPGDRLRLSGPFLGGCLTGFEYGLTAPVRTIEATALLRRDYPGDFGLRIWLVTPAG